MKVHCTPHMLAHSMQVKRHQTRLTVSGPESTNGRRSMYRRGRLRLSVSGGPFSEDCCLRLSASCSASGGFAPPAHLGRCQELSNCRQITGAGRSPRCTHFSLTVRHIIRTWCMPCPSVTPDALEFEGCC